MTQAQILTWQKTFASGFKRFQEKTGKDLPVFGRELMRVLVETMYHWTPPPTKGNRGSRGGRAGGKAAIKDDIYKVVEGRQLGYLKLLNEIYGGHIENATWKKKNSSNAYTLTNVVIDTSGEKIRGQHFSKRTRRGGVPGRAAKDGSNVSNKVLAPYAKVNKYVRETQKRVGKLKSGWAPALKELKSKLPPRWVLSANSMHGMNGPSSGRYTEDLRKKSAWKTSFVATARSPYMRDSDGFTRRAHKYVENVVMGRRLNSWVDSMIKKHGET